ncbi:hypothetical protein HGRIS_002987 [Hohenbuehelia grisea]|uniref:Uncharacterized protein n=1 Tax=Hohenbuehelia grisea TaxID=104357 RepID=A0ABR3JM54_9AGAR
MPQMLQPGERVVFVLLQYRHKGSPNDPYATVRAFSIQGFALAAYHIYRNAVTPTNLPRCVNEVGPGITMALGSGTWGARQLQGSLYERTVVYHALETNVFLFYLQNASDELQASVLQYCLSALSIGAVSAVPALRSTDPCLDND